MLASRPRTGDCADAPVHYASGGGCGGQHHFSALPRAFVIDCVGGSPLVTPPTLPTPRDLRPVLLRHRHCATD
jgi:hypothetical protein